MGPFLLERKAPLTGEESEGQGILDGENKLSTWRKNACLFVLASDPDA